mmetsp:Transcript_68057/g.149423  ORF Transcript_68057/g.149423 Transcript_68057/m.149423 type:complete len:107 (-) Transcript_68057:994-1314(-)
MLYVVELMYERTLWSTSSQNLLRMIMRIVSTQIKIATTRIMRENRAAASFKPASTHFVMLLFLQQVVMVASSTIKAQIAAMSPKGAKGNLTLVGRWPEANSRNFLI